MLWFVQLGQIGLGLAMLLFGGGTLAWGLARLQLWFAGLWPSRFRGRQGKKRWIVGIAKPLQAESLVQAPLRKTACVVYELRISSLQGGRTGTHAATLYREVRGRANVVLQTAQRQLILTRIGELDLQHVRLQDQQSLFQDAQLPQSQSLLRQHQIARHSLGMRRSLVLAEYRIDRGDQLRAYGEYEADCFVAALVTDKSLNQLLGEALAALAFSGLLLPLTISILRKALST